MYPWNLTLLLLIMIMVQCRDDLLDAESRVSVFEKGNGDLNFLGEEMSTSTVSLVPRAISAWSSPNGSMSRSIAI
jgi:hypothetical protein